MNEQEESIPEVVVEEVMPTVETLEKNDLPKNKDKTLLFSFIIGALFTFSSGIFIGILSGYTVYYFSTHEKSLLRSGIYGMFTGAICFIVIIIVTVIMLLM